MRTDRIIVQLACPSNLRRIIFRAKRGRRLSPTRMLIIIGLQPLRAASSVKACIERDYGGGYSVQNLRYMRQFYLMLVRQYAPGCSHFTHVRLHYFPDAPLNGAFRNLRGRRLAREKGQAFDLLLTRYGLERLLYRLSISPHRDRFVLKGAMPESTHPCGRVYLPPMQRERSLSINQCRNRVFSEADHSSAIGESHPLSA